MFSVIWLFGFFNGIFMSQKSKVSLRMLYDNVLVLPLTEDDVSSLIALPDSAKKKSTKGEIVAVGPGLRNASGDLMNLTVKSGDVVLYRQWAGTEVEIDGKKFMIMKESDISGIFE